MIINEIDLLLKEVENAAINCNNFNDFSKFINNDKLSNYIKSVKHEIFEKNNFDLLFQIENTFNNAKKTKLQRSEIKEIGKQKFINLSEQGIVFEKAFVKPDNNSIKKMINFINSNPRGRFENLTNTKVIASKNFGKPPGANEFFYDFISKIDYLNHYYDNNFISDNFRTRASIINPCSINSNGWHLDVFEDQIKVILLLSNVSNLNGPMTYAKETNNNNLLENSLKLHKFNVFKYGPGKRLPFGSRVGNYKQAHIPKGSSIAYLPDEYVNHCQIDLSQKEVNIANKKYKMAVCGGNIGDVIVFESSGFHSANIVQTGVRKLIIFSFPSAKSFKNVFLEKIKEISL